MDSIYKEVLKEYEKIRDNKKKSLKQAQNEIYKNIPLIEKDDKKLAYLGIKAVRKILEDPNQTEDLVNKLKDYADKVDIDKKNLLKKNNYNENSLEINYICPICKDTGYTNNNQMCSCMKQKLIDKAYNQSNLKDILKVENFSTFDLNQYSDEIDEVEGMSPRQNIEKVKDTCERFISTFDAKSENLLFYGNTGLGKTFLCNCIAKELLDKGKIVLYITAFQLFKIFEYQKFKDNDDLIDKDFDNLLTVDLLIIDDLGTEVNTVVTSSGFYNLINIRLLNKKQTIISTNLSPYNLKDIYSGRVISRIYGNYIVLKIFGTDIRMNKKYCNIKR